MIEDENQYIEIRREKLKSLRQKKINPYPNDIRPENLAYDILKEYAEWDHDRLEKLDKRFSIAGRIMAIRSFGKAAFLQIKDSSEKMQIFVQKQLIGDEQFELYKTVDVGDFLFAEGKLFRTKTNELTLAAEKIRIACKSLRPLPEKWHGLTDIETRYRQRYVDLIVNEKVKDTFIKRSKIVHSLRSFMTGKGFLEVETPMMHPIPGGATAKPFVTHHNALDQDLFMRVAPELYLKRLVVGGMERVFEINRNFRNEGISIQHNPEFTMMEFYMTYATYEDLIKLTEEMFSAITKEIVGTTKINYQGTEIDFTPPYKRYTLKQAIIEIGGVDKKILESREAALNYALGLGDELKSKKEGLDAILTEIFEILVEPKLIQPTFITQYPVEVSPLSRKNENDSTVVDRFELFIYGRELANAFSELNDPEDQSERFKKQVEALNRGDDEAMHFDYDFIRALEFGMPPAAGEGVGIDRLVMLLTDSASIRDVILFPQLKSK